MLFSKKKLLAFISIILISIVFFSTRVRQTIAQAACSLPLSWIQQGDLNCNQSIDVSDLTVLLSNFGKRQAGAPTPTPASSCTQFSVHLDAAQVSAEGTTVNSTATAMATVLLNTQTHTVSYTIIRDAAYPLTSSETVAHIHGPAARGQTAGPLHTLPTGNPKTGTWMGLTATQEQQVINGQTYINIHTSTYPNGEIRGQIENGISVSCSGATPTTGSGTPTPTPAQQALGVCNEPMDRWHPPVISQTFKDTLRTWYTSRGMMFPYESMTVGCATRHEHGDEPPTWITDSACIWSAIPGICDGGTSKYYVSYAGALHGHPVSSSGAAENTYKHVSMKGFYVPFPDKGVDVYFRMHFSSNPFERNATYHSTEVWARDMNGGVSHWQHWNYMGVGTGIGSSNPGAGLCVRRNPSQPCDSERPGIFPTVDGGPGYEVWYSPEHASSVGGNWVWGMGLLIGDPVARWTQAEGNGDGTATRPAINFSNPNDPLMDISQWDLVGSNKGVRRGMDSVAWYRGSNYRRPNGSFGPITEKMGTIFWATQFGQIVNGPTDLLCSQNHVAYDGKTYKNICLDQFIATTMREVSFPGNVQPEKAYPSTGVQIPN